MKRWMNIITLVKVLVLALDCLNPTGMTEVTMFKRVGPCSMPASLSCLKRKGVHIPKQCFWLLDGHIDLNSSKCLYKAFPWACVQGARLENLKTNFKHCCIWLAWSHYSTVSPASNNPIRGFTETAAHTQHMLWIQQSLILAIGGRFSKGTKNLQKKKIA